MWFSCLVHGIMNAFVNGMHLHNTLIILKTKMNPHEIVNCAITEREREMELDDRFTHITYN